jgi:hypothetical protein
MVQTADFPRYTPGGFLTGGEFAEAGNLQVGAPRQREPSIVSQVHELMRALRPVGRDGRGGAGPDSLAAPARGLSEGKS